MKCLLRKTGYCVIFYKKEGDNKLSFLIENEPELTKKILATVSTKRIKPKAIRFVLPALDELILNNNFKTEKDMSNSNPIVQLSELIQRQYGTNLEFTTPIKKGADHCPEVTVDLILPNGVKYTATASNQKLARQECAKQALAELL